MGITDSDFPMSSITGRANLLLTTSIGGGVHAGIKSPGLLRGWLSLVSDDLRLVRAEIAPDLELTAVQIRLVALRPPFHLVVMAFPAYRFE